MTGKYFDGRWRRSWYLLNIIVVLKGLYLLVVAGLEPATCRMLNCDPTLLCELLQLGDLSPTSSPLLLTGVSADKLKTSGSQDPRSFSVFNQAINVFVHRRSWVIFRGGPTIPSCQNSSPSCQNFFLSGGGQVRRFCSAMLSYYAKLFCQWANIVGEWLQNSQKWKKNRKMW